MIKATKELLIDKRKVLVFDNNLTEKQLDEFARRFYNAPFKKTEIGRPDTAAYTHWAHELDIKNLVNEAFWPATFDAVKQHSPDKKWRVYRAYVNYGGHGDAMFSHVDAKSEELTCLWYTVPQWNIDWAGETMFYDKNDEIAYACVPKPGRLVIFDSQLKHSGRPPSRNCLHSRFTLALKLEPIK